MNQSHRARERYVRTLQFLIPFSGAAWTKFQTAYFLSVGLSPTAAGALTSASLMVKLLSYPLWGLLADLHGSHQLVLVWAIFLANLALLVLQVGMPWLVVRPTYLLIVRLARSVFNSSWSLVDALTLKHTADQPHKFGSHRLFGSIAFGLGSLAAGFVIDWTGQLSAVFYYTYVTNIPLFLLVLYDQFGGGSNAQETGTEIELQQLRNQWEEGEEQQQQPQVGDDERQALWDRARHREAGKEDDLQLQALLEEHNLLPLPVAFPSTKETQLNLDLATPQLNVNAAAHPGDPSQSTSAAVAATIAAQDTNTSPALLRVDKIEGSENVTPKHVTPAKRFMTLSLQQGHKLEKQFRQFGRLLRDGQVRFCLPLLACYFAVFSLADDFLFMQLAKEFGIHGGYVGLLVWISTLATVVVFATSPRFLETWSWNKLVLLAQAALFFRLLGHIYVGHDSSRIWLLMGLQLLHGLNFGLVWVVARLYLDAAATHHSNFTPPSSPASFCISKESPKRSASPRRIRMQFPTTSEVETGDESSGTPVSAEHTPPKTDSANTNAGKRNRHREGGIHALTHGVLACIYTGSKGVGIGCASYLFDHRFAGRGGPVYMCGAVLVFFNILWTLFLMQRANSVCAVNSCACIASSDSTGETHGTKRRCYHASESTLTLFDEFRFGGGRGNYAET
eukprot:gb/GEZN01002829.1/.p1 GENE.gb/GEZN01002829.1/~~gb/GEZN01002829.1/.p1  ORF type:complete len:677 (-),score=97.39 gb/GEZN01002829.1/:227-2257(-)